MNYVIFNSSTGRIERWGVCQDGMMDRQVIFSGQIAMESDATGVTHYVDLSAAPVIVPFPLQPSVDHVWNWTAHAWAANLDDAKARVIGLAKAERDRRIYAGFVWSGSRFDSDETAQTRILGLFVSTGSAPGMFPVMWRLADNSWRALSVADSQGVWGALQAHIAAHFESFAAHEAAIGSLTDLADVQAYDVTKNWP